MSGSDLHQLEVQLDSDHSSSSSSSSSSELSSHSVPFQNVDSAYTESGSESGTESDSPTNDQFDSNLGLSSSVGDAPLVSRMPAKSFEHESFRDRKKREMRHGSFTYKQVSDNATPTAHRKQLFSKRSACKLTTNAEEKMGGSKHVKVNGYYFLKSLGKGAYGEVRLATKDLVEDDFSQHTSRYAIKVMKRSMFEERKELPYRGRRRTAEDVVAATQEVKRNSSGPLEDESIPSSLLREINIMKRLAHPNLVKLKEIINDDNSKYLFLVLEYIQGGTIMTHNEKTDTYVYSLTKKVMLEGTARRVFKELASALSYLHANHIAHRDIKPDNLLITLDGKLKLSDFGVSTHFESDRQKHSISMKSLARSTSRGQMQQTEGTFAFYSPEMCSTDHSPLKKKNGYNAYMADLWASAVCLWIFVFGTVPFQSHDVTELFRSIREDHPTRPHRLSPELDNLLGLMMRKEVSRRPSVMDVRHHCWVSEKPLSQHGEVIVDMEVNNISAVAKSSLLSTTVNSQPTPSSSSTPVTSLVPPVPGNKNGQFLFAKTAESVVSPAIRKRLAAWAARSRKICFSRNRNFVVKGQAEVNALVRKAMQKHSESIKEEDNSDDSSCFSLGSADSSSSGNESLVSVTDMLKSTNNEFENVFGSFELKDDNDDDDYIDATAMKHRSAPASSHASKDGGSNERNIFQRGIHKIEKRLLELQKQDSSRSASTAGSGGELSGNDDVESPRRRSLVQRGIHKVAKKISFTGANTDRHLNEDKRTKSENDKMECDDQPDKCSTECNEDAEEEGSNTKEEKSPGHGTIHILDWFSRTKTT